ncbi:phosphomevalonate kinase [Streptomyces sp. NPDC051909]|uniref:phosphomevalonate kinase n=1 Tax=Streptomyces sp. NPDC051909 TaxID=3154944 RepID=UPI003449506B
MTRRHTVERLAPGKLFIAGEYAVVEPGNPAILAAVDRCVRVTATGSDADGKSSDGAEVTIVSDLAPNGVRLLRSRGVLVGHSVGDEQRARRDLAHVVSAIETVDALRVERELYAPALHVSVISELHDSGVKFGLGSSGAVTVATIDAVAACYGMRLSREALFRLAMLATARIDTGPSGGDLAAAVWGGWIGYRAPDRDAVLAMARRHGVEETLSRPWPHEELRQLPPPSGLTVEIGWTGRPASTTDLVAGWNTPALRSGITHQEFLADSAECVRAISRALVQQDGEALLHQIRAARLVLARLERRTGISIFTPRLTALCATAEAVGAAAKPSGAGGGDCGIALLPSEAAEALTRLRARWTAAGVVPLPIRTSDRKDLLQ